MRLKSLSFAAVALTVMLLASMVVQATAQPSIGDQGGAAAEAMVKVAAKAEARVKAFIEAVQANQTIMAAVQNAGLMSAFDGNVSLLERGSALLASANESLAAGNCSDAASKAVQAMKIFRDMFVNVHRILEQAGVEEAERPEVEAQGLLEAIQRALERIEQIEALPNAADVEGILDQAKNLLNVTEAEQLLAQGNVTEVAHRLAEANKLIAEAFKELKSKAEEEMQARAEKFVEKLQKKCGEIEDWARNAGLNASEVMEDLGLGNFSQLKEDLVERIRSMKPVDVKGMIDELKEIGKRVGDAEKGLKGLQPVKAKVGDILSNPESWENKTVMVVGNYCDGNPPQGLPGPSVSPPSAHYWIIADETGWIYVVDGKIAVPIKLPEIKLPDWFKNAKAMVVGKVEAENGSPYIDAIFAAVVPQIPFPPIREPASGAISLTVEKQQALKGYMLKISVANVGNEAVVFPNAACGIVIERKVGDAWLPYYTPISLQLIVELKPGESRTVTVNLLHPPKGAYRAVALGWLKESHIPVKGAAEFSIP